MKSEKKKRSSEKNAAVSRRRFISTVAQSAVAATCFANFSAASAYAQATAPASGRRKRVVILATEVRKHSHAQHFIDRFLEGYGWQGRHYRPEAELAGIYVDQFPERDLSRDRERRHNTRIYPTIAETLTLGGSKLAVDGVLIIAEHGRYPRNAKGQTRYPRYRFFKEVVKVFEESGRSVPVFNDKHLSTDWNESVEMVEDAKRLNFPFLAGSSLPVTWRIPSIDMAAGTELQESVCVCYGGVDSYDFHGLETVQCMSERRAGGEVGVKSVHATRGANVWKVLGDYPTTQKLLLAALARSHTCKAPPGFTAFVPTLSWIQQASPDAVGYFIEHLDGLRTTVFVLNGLVQDFTYAGLVKTTGKIVSCQMQLPMPGQISTTADFFNPLVHHIEDMVLTGVAPYPVQRTLLTSGMTLFAVESLYRGQVPLLTPEMKVAYEAPALSTFWRS